MGLAAFKVLGASWAVHQVLSRWPAGDEVVLVTATDGNHGRAVARMARLFGRRAHVFVPRGVHPTAVAAIAAEGAQITKIAGTYDEAVRLAAEAAREPGTALVQDAGWPGYEQVPTLGRRGLRDLVLRGRRAAFRGGSGRARPGGHPRGSGLAGAGRRHPLPQPAGLGATALLTVEPGTAACVLASLVRGRAGHHRHQRDDHGRADLRHPFHAGLALPARWPGRGGRRYRCRQRHGGSGPGGLRDTGLPVRRGLAGRRPGRAHRRGRGGTAGLAGHPPRRDGGAAEHRRICGQPGAAS